MGGLGVRAEPRHRGAGRDGSLIRSRQVDGRLGSGKLEGPEGHSSMIELILFTTVGLGLLTGFLALGFQGPPHTVTDRSVLTAVGQMVRLEGLAFTNTGGLLDDSEYRLLCSN